MRQLEQWAARWQIAPGALTELAGVMGIDYSSTPHDTVGMSEAAIQQRVRLDSSKHGARLWRNNNGATLDESGRMIRFGLGNDSATVNGKMKSSDLIGITPTLITPADVGRTVGIFTSIEVKAGGWRFSGRPRETAQLAWGTLVIKLGGIFKFTTTGEGWR